MTLDRFSRVAVSVFACICLLAGASWAADELVDNPTYKSWSRHKVGSTVELQSNTDAGGQTLKTIVTQTLVELTPEKAVVEMNIKIDVPGATSPAGQKQTFAAKVKKQDAAASKLPQGMIGEVKDKGTEKVDIAGKSYTCEVYEFGGDRNGVKSTGKIWRTEEMPGTLVKMESTSNVGGRDMKTSMAVTKVESK